VGHEGKRASVAYLDEVAAWFALEGGYEHQQQTRPLTLAPALSDSPVGLLSWILENHRAEPICCRLTEDRYFSRWTF
jgi:hypothetical protein